VPEALRAALLGACLLPAAAVADIELRRAEVNLRDGFYQLQARVEYDLSEEVRRALEHGIAVALVTDIELQRQRPWWWDALVARARITYLLEYHVLTRQYLVTEQASGRQLRYADLPAALAAIGTIRDYPLIGSGELQPQASYQLRLRARLDLGTLPAPMRPIAFLESEWRMIGPWHRLRLP